MSSIDIDAAIADADATFPALFQLFGGYFHQDWRSDHTTPAAALGAFLDEAPAQAVGEAVAELDRLLDAGADDASLARLLREGFDCNYVPEHDGLTATGWLTAVRGRLQPGA